MRLEELDGPGTEYAIRAHDYEAPSRARLLGVESREVGDELRPRSRRFARMFVEEGSFGKRPNGQRPEGGLLVKGRHILLTWEEYEQRVRDREERRSEHELAKAAAADRCTEARRRTAALGIDVGERDVAENAGLQQAFGRWWESHLMVPVEVYEALLERAENERNVIEHARRLGMPTPVLREDHGAMLTLMREASSGSRDRTKAALPAAPLTLPELATSLGWEMQRVELTLRDLIEVGMMRHLEFEALPISERHRYELTDAGAVEASHEHALST